MLTLSFPPLAGPAPRKISSALADAVEAAPGTPASSRDVLSRRIVPALPRKQMREACPAQRGAWTAVGPWTNYPDSPRLDIATLGTGTVRGGQPRQSARGGVLIDSTAQGAADKCRVKAPLAAEEK